MVSRKQKKEIEDMADIEENIQEGSEASFDRDLETSRDPRYSSDDMPTDIYRYKRMRLVPNSETEFPGLVDKDIVLANVKDNKPDPQYLRFIAETIVAMDVFSKKVERVVVVKDASSGRLVTEKQIILVPDPEFDIIRDFLRSGFKADLTLSRAMGKDREAVLDRTQNIGKEIRRPDKQNKYGG